MKQVLRNHSFQITFDKDFEQVIQNCKEIKRIGQGGTWITADMKRAYIKLHELGLAKSVEVWDNEVLVGGLYGVDLGDVFCGESMFALSSNASKVAFVSLVRKFQERGGRLIDCQVYTNHLSRLGAEEMSRTEFLRFL